MNQSAAPDRPQATESPSPAKRDEELRLSKALRENLKRRKAQQQAGN